MRLRWSILTLLGLFLLLPAIPAPPSSAATKWTVGAPIVLRGTVVTPDAILKRGYVLIENGRIASVSDKSPDVDGATKLDTEGIIVPGLVDVHNHVPWNVLPRWTPPHLFSNRYEWRADADFLEKVGHPFENLGAVNEKCDMGRYAEVRALAGGTTSILATHPDACVQGLVRNLDFASGFYAPNAPERVVSAIELPATTDPVGRTIFVQRARFAINSPAFEALFLHLSEGIDAASLEEFTFIRTNGLLNPKGSCIHCIALGSEQFQAMAAAGTSLVWSPSSNVRLYGTTTDIDAALDAGVRIALAPDWAVSGSGNMLEELHFADQWNRDHLDGRLTDQQLFAMVTSVPAAMARIDDEVGAIRPGLRADLLVIGGDINGPHRALIEATPADVQLVVIAGTPVYGDAEKMGAFWDAGNLQPIDIGERRKTLAGSPAGFSFADAVGNLQTALQMQGLSLAPLTEPEP